MVALVLHAWQAPASAKGCTSSGAASGRPEKRHRCARRRCWKPGMFGYRGMPGSHVRDSCLSPGKGNIMCVFGEHRAMFWVLYMFKLPVMLLCFGSLIVCLVVMLCWPRPGTFNTRMLLGHPDTPPTSDVSFPPTWLDPASQPRACCELRAGEPALSISPVRLLLVSRDYARPAARDAARSHGQLRLWNTELRHVCLDADGQAR